jgi:hypothetical protein
MIAMSAQATAYFVSQEEAKASDADAGTADAPWRTISRNLKEQLFFGVCGMPASFHQGDRYAMGEA